MNKSAAIHNRGWNTFVQNLGSSEAVMISFVLVTISYLLQGNIGINLADEGFLWYGAWRTKLGDVPIRDFSAYDPARYYWSLLWSKILGDGLLSLRMSAAIFQFLGLTCALLSLKRAVNSRVLLVLAGFAMLLWMFPRHKLYEHSIAMAAVYFGLLLFEKPVISRYFIAGIFTGCAAFFGKNHGVYAFGAYLIIIGIIHCKISSENWHTKILAWLSGICLGYFPMIFMLIFVPGFSGAFWESIVFLLNLGGTNISLPVPWPWLFSFSNQGSDLAIRQILVGSIFLAMPLYFLVSFGYLLIADGRKLKTQALFVVSSVVGIMYMHFAFSRADAGHLAQSIHPFLLSVMAVPYGVNNIARLMRSGTIAVMLLISLFSIGLFSPYYLYVRHIPDQYTACDINGDRIIIDPQTATLIASVRRINLELVGANEQFLIAPHWPLFYALLQRKAPLWETYFLFHRPDVKQISMIKRLKSQKTDWVLLGDVTLDGRDDLRFKNTHRLLWEYFHLEFEEIKWDGLPPNYKLLKRKAG